MLSRMEGRGERLSIAPAAERPALSRSGLLSALRRLRDPLLFGVLPVLYAASVLTSAYDLVGIVGFDFRGTIWAPARAALEGAAIYPEPTRASIELGNPAVYPPFIVLLATPFALLPAGAAALLWSVVLGATVALALWLVGVRDWRCYPVALASAPVLEGIFWGNLTLLMLLPLAVAWRWRERAAVAGLAIGAAVAAKLFVWPLVFWLLFTRRFRAAAWAAGAALALVLGAWAVIGFEGVGDYPALLRELQETYAPRSLSLATIVSGFEASVTTAVAITFAAGAALVLAAAWAARRAGGDLRAFALAVAACVVAAPIVWLHYLAVLFVPVAIRWPRLAVAWFFGYAVLLAERLPGLEYVVPEPCCRPEDVPKFVWDVNHGIAEPWQALGVVSVVALAVLAVWRRGESGSGATR